MKGKTIILFFMVAAMSVLLAEEYKKPVEISEIGFTAKYMDGKVVINWKKYLREDFSFYKVVKSQWNPKPVYPDDGYVYYSENRNDTSYIDWDIKPGTWYYSITIVTYNGDRWTAPAVKIEIPKTQSSVPGASDFQ